MINVALKYVPMPGLSMLHERTARQLINQGVLMQRVTAFLGWSGSVLALAFLVTDGLLPPLADGLCVLAGLAAVVAAVIIGRRATRKLHLVVNSGLAFYVSSEMYTAWKAALQCYADLVAELSAEEKVTVLFRLKEQYKSRLFDRLYHNQVLFYQAETVLEEFLEERYRSEQIRE